MPALLGLALAPPAGAEVRVTEGIVYGHARVNEPAPRDTDLGLDLYEPATKSGRRPAVVLMHGGGFRLGTREQPALVEVAKKLAERGIVVASIDYRLIPDDPVPSARVAPVVAAVPAGDPLYRAMVVAIDDTLTALDWLRANSQELRIDPNRLGLAGASAGAITAGHVAYALDDLGVEVPRLGFVGDLWGGLFIPSADPRDAARLLERGEAPLFAIHGVADTTVPVALDNWLVWRAAEAGVPVEYHQVPDGEHGFLGTGFFTRRVARGQTAFDRMLDFAEATLDPGRCAIRLRGSSARDRLLGTTLGDRIAGRGGSDILRGRSGADCLAGGDGRDRLLGGAGRDRIDARGGGRDRVDCGGGRDLARVDPDDRVGSNCETVRVAALDVEKR